MQDPVAKFRFQRCDLPVGGGFGNMAATLVAAHRPTGHLWTRGGYGRPPLGFVAPSFAPRRSGRCSVAP